MHSILSPEESQKLNAKIDFKMQSLQM